MGSPSVPQLPLSARAGLVKAYRKACGALCTVLEELLSKGLPVNPAQLRDFEATLHQDIARRCADVITEAVLVASLSSTEVAVEQAAIIGLTRHLTLQKSAQSVSVTLLGGSTMTVETPYYLVRPRKRRGPKRAKGKRGKQGNGRYPQLASLGIHYRVTPALASEVGRLVALGTVGEAVDTLSSRGVSLDKKAVSRLAQCLGERGLRYRDWLNSEEAPKNAVWARGCRIAIGIDGGRVRTRTTNKGAKRKSGHRGFTATWREPKVLTVYKLDHRGRKITSTGALYDATLQDADGIFALLAALLKRLGADQAREWVILGDGAPWIWDRIEGLVQRVGFKRENVIEVLDFYHACEHITEATSVVKRFSESEQRVWYGRLKWLLRTGRVQTMISELEEEYTVSKPEAGERILNYFKTHSNRLEYARFRRSAVPMGSGAVESAVRRIVNLRLKGNGIFWCPDNAEAVLHMRAQVLSGTWRDFVANALTDETRWKADPISVTVQGRRHAERRAA